MHVCVQALFIEAAVFVAVGFITGIIFGLWQAIVFVQPVLALCEIGGYFIGGMLWRRRRDREGR
jgi:hypothetical protein